MFYVEPSGICLLHTIVGCCFWQHALVSVCSSVIELQCLCRLKKQTAYIIHGYVCFLAVPIFHALVCIEFRRSVYCKLNLLCRIGGLMITPINVIVSYFIKSTVIRIQIYRCLAR